MSRNTRQAAPALLLVGNVFSAHDTAAVLLERPSPAEPMPTGANNDFIGNDMDVAADDGDPDSADGRSDVPASSFVAPAASAVFSF